MNYAFCYKQFIIGAVIYHETGHSQDLDFSGLPLFST